MADAATSNRGLNDLLTTPVALGDRIMRLPHGHEAQIPVAGDISTKALFLDNAARGTTGFLTEGNRTGVISLADNNWHSIDWDPEVSYFTLTPIDATGTDGIEFTTDPAAAANAGMELPEGRSETFYVVDAPLGRIYIRRTAAGNGGNGSNTVKVNHIAHGSRNMLSSSRRNVNTAHS